MNFFCNNNEYLSHPLYGDPRYYKTLNKAKLIWPSWKHFSMMYNLGIGLKQILDEVHKTYDAPPLGPVGSNFKQFNSISRNIFFFRKALDPSQNHILIKFRGYGFPNHFRICSKRYLERSISGSFSEYFCGILIFLNEFRSLLVREVYCSAA